MRPLRSDQNGHNRLSFRYFATRKWHRIPVAVLRQFAREKRDEYRQRGLAELVGLSQGAVSDFILGKTEPESRTIKAFGKFYLDLHPEGYVEKRKRDVEREVLPQLKAVLPPGEQAAIDTIEAMIEAARASGVFDGDSEPLRDWLTTVVAAEYSTERRYAHLKRKRKAKGNPSPDREPPK